MIQIWISLLLLIFLGYILRLLSKKEVEMRNVLSWFVLPILALPLIWFPSLLGGLSHLLGFQVPSNLIFFLGFCLLLYLNFSLTRLTSKQAIQIRTLAQTLALYEKRELDEKED